MGNTERRKAECGCGGEKKQNIINPRCNLKIRQWEEKDMSETEQASRYV